MPRLGPGSGGGGGDSTPVPSGEYIVVLRSFKRQVGKTGQRKEYLRCRWEIIAGKCRGKSFFSNMALDVTVEGTANRWRILMEACGVDEEFELGSMKEGTQDEGDDNIRRLFVKKPFVATVKVERNGQYTNNDLERIHYRRLWTEEQTNEIEAYLDAQENAGSGGGGASDDWDGQGAGGGGGTEDDDQPPVDDWGEPASKPKAGGFAGDDDIPF